MPTVMPSMRSGGPGLRGRGETERSRWMSRTTRVMSTRSILDPMAPTLALQGPVVNRTGVQPPRTHRQVVRLDVVLEGFAPVLGCCGKDVRPRPIGGRWYERLVD